MEGTNEVRSICVNTDKFINACQHKSTARIFSKEKDWMWEKVKLSCSKTGITYETELSMLNTCRHCQWLYNKTANSGWNKFDSIIKEMK